VDYVVIGISCLLTGILGFQYGYNQGWRRAAEEHDAAEQAFRKQP
jgi:hypothetical protein